MTMLDNSRRTKSDVVGLGNRRSIRLSYGRTLCLSTTSKHLGRNATRETRGNQRSATAQTTAHSVAYLFASCHNNRAATMLATPRGPIHHERLRFAMSDKPSTQYVYFIQAGDGGPVKIGTTNNPMRRVGALQTSHPEPLSLLGTVLGGREIERHWHKKWEAQRMRGEWFAYSDALIDCIFDSTTGSIAKRAKWGEQFGPFLDWRGELCTVERRAYRAYGVSPADVEIDRQLAAIEARRARMYRRRARREKVAA